MSSLPENELGVIHDNYNFIDVFERKQEYYLKSLGDTYFVICYINGVRSCPHVGAKKYVTERWRNIKGSKR